MKVSAFRITLLLLYIGGFVVLAGFAAAGWQYYTLALVDRPHSPLHVLFKPGGDIGHGLGIVGSSMVLLLFLYSVRKRRALGLRMGRMSRWLDVHIWLGIMGPLLITLHTAFKFNGIVSISYYSMLAVMFSGFFGRYIYMQIPRDETGLALSLQQIDQHLDQLGRTLVDRYQLSAAFQTRLAAFARALEQGSSSHIAVLFKTFLHDLARPWRIRRLRKALRREQPDLPATAIRQVVNLARKRSSLMRRKAALQSMNAVFHLWHVIHKPFAIVMVIIMFIHVAVTVLMGYTWIF